MEYVLFTQIKILNLVTNPSIQRRLFYQNSIISLSCKTGFHICVNFLLVLPQLTVCIAAALVYSFTMGYLLDKFDYTRKTIVYAQQHDISRLNVKLNSLLKQRDIIKNGNMRGRQKSQIPKICPVCNCGIGKGLPFL
jgi:hypothetical protein